MSRPSEPALIDPATDRRRTVRLNVAANFLGMSASALRRRIEDGLIPAHRDGKVYRIRVAALVHYKRNPPDSSS